MKKPEAIAYFWHLSWGDEVELLTQHRLGFKVALLIGVSSTFGGALLDSPAAQSATIGGRGGQFQPAASGHYLAWERNTRERPHHFDVLARTDGRVMKVNAPGTNAANGSIEGDFLVYQQWRGGRSDLKLFDLVTGRRTSLPRKVNTRRWEYWPSMSAQWLLFGRRRGLANRSIVLYNLASGRARILDSVRSPADFLAPGQVNGDFVVWWKCRKGRSCWVFRYKISTGTRERVPRGGRHLGASSVGPAGTVYFAQSKRTGCGSKTSLMRYRRGVLTRIRRIPPGLQIGDTYVTSGAFGNVRVYFDRFACRRAAASDIFRTRDPLMHRLSVDVRGSGFVRSDPRGIRCGVDCRQNHAGGTSVTLFPAAAPGFEFLGWGGDCTGVDTCTVVMDGTMKVSATFAEVAQDKDVLTIVKPADATGTGVVVSVDPGGVVCGMDCTEIYDTGSSVDLLAAAHNDSRFEPWGGACEGFTKLSCSVTVEGDNSVIANFARRQATLTATTRGGGNVTVTRVGKSLPSFDCSSGCLFDVGETVTLNAHADEGSGFSFAGWEGGCGGDLPLCSIPMDGDRFVIANFEWGLPRRSQMSVIPPSRGEGSVGSGEVGATFEQGA